VNLVSEVRIQEGLRQDEVTAYEFKKKKLRSKKSTFEQLRIDGIKNY
jgi:hypothetical protein